MSDMKIGQKVVSGVSVGRIEGRLDVQGAVVLETYAQQRLGAGEVRLVLDLAGVDYISSAGLRSLLVVAKKVQAVNGSLVLCALTPTVLNIMSISGFQQLLKICATEEEAVAVAASVAR
jgi:stage II sporulation protein AA (anti-sigma F factor antagonist)